MPRMTRAACPRAQDPSQTAAIPLQPSDVRLCWGKVRIPAVEVTNQGTLLVSYERRWRRGDETPHDIYLKRSVDGGRTWRFGRRIAGNWRCIESSVAKLADGTVHLTMRCSDEKVTCRNVALRRNGGITWERPLPHPAFSQPQFQAHGCHSCVARLTDESHYDRNRLLYSGHRGNTREELTISISYDEGQTWRPLKVIKEGSAGYSNLVVFPDLSIGCIYESFAPVKNEIRFVCFTLAWLTDGQDKVVAQERPASESFAGRSCPQRD